MLKIPPDQRGKISDDYTPGDRSAARVLRKILYVVLWIMLAGAIRAACAGP